ncbi:hypothetical protein GGR56DRAFT_278421 [Xylariaceae sp. FL0804]|nr:hypothetical protein GGR56DRAFT_278421 [Xylariaceae sp. FL0804]
MPSEEMEISTELGQPSFGEDIEIDFDDITDGHQDDEDMDLGDPNPTQDLENFNSDVRDEMMAERDDASFGMVDADDVEHNLAAAAANDFDIDIGDPDESTWQDATVVDEFSNPAEIDYVEDIDTGDVQVEEHEASTTSPAMVSTDLLSTTTTYVSVQNVVSEETLGSSNGKDELLSDELQLAGDDTHGLEQHQEQQTGSDIDHDAYRIFEHQEPSTRDEDPEVGSDYAAVIAGSHLDDNAADIPALEQNTAAEVRFELQEREEPVGDVLNLDNTVDQAGQDDLALGADAQYQATETEAGLESQEFGEQMNPVFASNSSEIQPGDKMANDLSLPDGVAQQDPHMSGSAASDHLDGGESEPTAEDVADSNAINDESRAAVIGDAQLQTPGDMSALELPLSGFLSRLRDVISEEVSPLDELVMHVDGLGLEFSESTSSQFLENYTFRSVVVLYDKLVTNDHVESPPDLYIYLMVRPSCNQRLLALVDSAEAGRGLSEIAVYRESTPFDGEEPFEGEKPFDEEERPNDEEERLNDEENLADEEEHLDGQEPFDGANLDEAGTVQEEEPFDEEDASNSGNQGKSSSMDTYNRDETDSEAKGALKATAQTSNGDVDHDSGPNAGTVHTHGAPVEEAIKEYQAEGLDQHGTAVDPSDDLNGLQTEELTDPDLTGTKAQGRQTMAPAAAPLPPGAPTSDNTSATATLDGNDQDIIDYSDDEGQGGMGDTDPAAQMSSASATGRAPPEDEITWESDDEDAENLSGNGIAKPSSKPPIQVSSVSGKRARSDLDGVESASDQNDVKRRRS